MPERIVMFARRARAHKFDRRHINPRSHNFPSLANFPSAAHPICKTTRAEFPRPKVNLRPSTRGYQRRDSRAEQLIEFILIIRPPRIILAPRPLHAVGSPGDEKIGSVAF